MFLALALLSLGVAAFSVRQLVLAVFAHWIAVAFLNSVGHMKRSAWGPLNQYVEGWRFQVPLKRKSYFLPLYLLSKIRTGMAESDAWAEMISVSPQLRTAFPSAGALSDPVHVEEYVGSSIMADQPIIREQKYLPHFLGYAFLFAISFFASMAFVAENLKK